MLTFIGFQLFHDSNPHKICNKTQAGMLYTNGSPTGKTGAPGENNCTQCHSGSVNDGSLFSNLSFSGVNEYSPGSTYNLTLNIQNGAVKNGFQLVALDSLTASNAGTLIVTDAIKTQLSSGSGRTYLNHRNSGTIFSSWSFDWKAPSTNVGPVTFYYAYNVTNNAWNTGGDQIYLADFTVYPSSCGSFSSSIQTTDITCYGDRDGIISVTPTGGIPPYSYSWNNGLTSSYVDTLGSGTYSIVVSDANGCSDTLTATINEPPLLSNTNTVNHVTCFGGVDGAIYPNVTGGVPPYIYIWSNGVPFADNVGIPAFTYHLLVFDANGCLDSSAVQVTQPPLLTSIDTVVSCGPFTWIDGQTYYSSTTLATHSLIASNGCDSIVALDLTVNDIDLTVTNNSPNLLSNQSNAQYQWLDCDNSFSTLAGQTNQNFTATSNGNYAVQISYNNCVDTTSCIAVSNVALCQDCEEEISYYPNPVIDFLYIKNIQKQNDFNIQILDLSSKILVTSKDSRLDLTSLASGVYIVKIYNNSQELKFKILKD
ncbi:MAG: choice-of-anchor V domain-containing protein [Bacteroidota bacterium]|nr:choice-of-anchor V domain-containing protein [Bacteroidota bacterium]